MISNELLDGIATKAGKQKRMQENVTNEQNIKEETK